MPPAEYGLTSNVISIQPKLSKKHDTRIVSDPKEALALMKAFIALQSPEDRLAVLRLAEQLASK